MTSIEYIIKQLEEQGLIYKSINNELSISISSSDYLDIKRLAKEMHKQEIIDAFKSGLKSPYHQDYTFVTQENQEGTKSGQYYQETFVSKGNDEMATNCSQQEISDEEIEQWAKKYKHYFEGDYQDLALTSFIAGCIWYREQLKSK